MKGVQNISAGYDHAVAVLKDKTIKGWGVSKYFSNNLNSERLLKPVDLTA
jgi:alpha-tubulin suppressor-like RCC1 family protein